jgi:hypothetical protein
MFVTFHLAGPELLHMSGAKYCLSGLPQHRLRAHLSERYARVLLCIVLQANPCG